MRNISRASLEPSLYLRPQPQVWQTHSRKLRGLRCHRSERGLFRLGDIHDCDRPNSSRERTSGTQCSRAEDPETNKATETSLSSLEIDGGVSGRGGDAIVNQEQQRKSVHCAVTDTRHSSCTSHIQERNCATPAPGSHMIS